MPGVLTSLEQDLRCLGAITGIAIFVYATYRVFRAQTRPTGYQSFQAPVILRSRYLILTTILVVAVSILLWRPLPIQLGWLAQLGLSLFGALLLFLGLSLYLWGMHTLGESFNASSGFGVRLQLAHRLVVTGPFAWMRHPMYVGLILAAWGGLLLYRTWTMLLFVVLMFSLVVRARHEEAALAEVFGSQYELYCINVPAWFPRLMKLFPGYNNRHISGMRKE
jgi:protein-S-isoprenylcysteine O-methyltransferase Ste14